MGIYLIFDFLAKWEMGNLFRLIIIIIFGVPQVPGVPFAWFPSYLVYLTHLLLSFLTISLLRPNCIKWSRALTSDAVHQVGTEKNG